MQKRKETWSVSDAKARFSEVVERALSDGPQLVTRNGRRAVVVVSAKDWERKAKRRGSLVDFFADSPLRNSGLKIERMKDMPRAIDL